MAISIQSEASNGCSVNNEMLFVVYESTKATDPVTYPDYSYVCDVYVSSALVARLVSRPDPTYNKGVFDVARVLQGYCTYGIDISSSTVDYNPKISYRLKFGEQYNGTLYTSLVNDSTDRYAYKTYKARPFLSSSVLQNGLASNMPSVVNWHKGQAVQLIPYFSDVSGVTTIYADHYDSSGNLLSTNSVDNTLMAAGAIRQWNMGPQTADYSILHGAGVSLRVNHLCDGKYPGYTLAWLNPFGAYDTQSFGLVSKKRIETTDKGYSQLNYRVDSGGAVSYQANSAFYGGKRGYYKSARVLLSLTSHLLNDDEYEWLADLFMSPDVYIYDNDLECFIPVTITATSYEYRTYLNSRLVPLQFDIEFTDPYNAQML